MVRRGFLMLALLVASLVAGGLVRTEAAGGADLHVSVTPPASAVVGQVKTFQYSLSNAGPETATNVTLTLSLPAGASIGFYDPSYPTCYGASTTSAMVCTFASIGAGETRTARLDLYLDTLGGNTSTASVTSDTADPNTANNGASGTVNVQGVTSDAVAFLSGPAGDLIVGDVPNYHLTLGSLGPDQVYLPITAVVTLPPEFSGPVGLSFADGYPTSCSVGSNGAFTCSDVLASCTYAGGTADTFSCTIFSPLTGIGPAWYSAAHVDFSPHVTSAGTGVVSADIQPITGLTEVNPSNDTASVTTTVFAAGSPRADLVVSQTSPSSSAWNANFDYTITVSNSGPNSVGPVSVSDRLPDDVSFVAASGASCAGSATITCTIAALASGEQRVVSVTVSPVLPGAATAVATVSAPAADANQMNNSASATTAVLPQPGTDVAGSLTGATNGGVGVPYSYRFTVTNTGTDSLTNPLINSYFPAADFDEVTTRTSDGTACQLGGGWDGIHGVAITIVACRIPSIEAGQNWSVDIGMRPLATGDFNVGGQVTLFSGSDPSPSDNSGSFMLHVDPAAAPAITCPAGVSAVTDAGLSTATLDVGTPAITGGTLPVEVTGVRSDALDLNSAFPFGATSITWTATDADGRTADCMQAVTVTDPELPVSTAIAPAGWSTSSVTVVVGATDNVAVAAIHASATGAGAFAEMATPGNSAEVRVSAEGDTVLSYWAVDSSGNAETPHTLTLDIDTHAPEVRCASADASWHASNVSLLCTASDGTSGLAQASDASFALSTTVAAGSESVDAQTESHRVCDQAGNCSEAGPIGGNQVDRKVPTISLTAPADGASFVIGAAVSASYTCSDGGSGVASCSGTLTNGAHLDTSSAGTKDFEVDATDGAGNSITVRHSYTVGYALCSLRFSPPAAAGPVLGIRFELCDANAQNLSSPSLAVSVTALDGEPAGVTHHDPDGTFRLAGGKYLYTLRLPKSLAPGTHHLGLSITGDPTTYILDFTVR